MLGRSNLKGRQKRLRELIGRLAEAKEGSAEDLEIIKNKFGIDTGLSPDKIDVYMEQIEGAKIIEVIEGSGNWKYIADG